MSYAHVTGFRGRETWPSPIGPSKKIPILAIGFFFGNDLIGLNP